MIRPSLQLRLICSFLGIAALALTLQYILFLQVVTRTATRLPHDGLQLMDLMNGSLTYVLLLSFCVLLPCTFLVGILATQRVAGPIHRLERYLEQVRDGERPADVRLRKGDELTALARLINEATAPLRATVHPTANEAQPERTKPPEESEAARAA